MNVSHCAMAVENGCLEIVHPNLPDRFCLTVKTGISMVNALVYVGSKMCTSPSFISLPSLPIKPSSQRFATEC